MFGLRNSRGRPAWWRRESRASRTAVCHRGTHLCRGMQPDEGRPRVLPIAGPPRHAQRLDETRQASWRLSGTLARARRTPRRRPAPDPAQPGEGRRRIVLVRPGQCRDPHGDGAAIFAQCAGPRRKPGPSEHKGTRAARRSRRSRAGGRGPEPAAGTAAQVGARPLRQSGLVEPAGPGSEPSAPGRREHFTLLRFVIGPARWTAPAGDLHGLASGPDDRRGATRSQVRRVRGTRPPAAARPGRPRVTPGSWSERLNGGHRAVAVAPVLAFSQVERIFALGAAVGRVGLEPTADGL